MSDGNKVVVEIEVEAKTAAAAKDLAQLEKGLSKASEKARELGRVQSKESVQAAAAATEAQRKYQLQLEINRARVENMAEAQRKANAEAQRTVAAQNKAAAAAQKLAAEQARASAAMDKVSSKHGPNMAKTLERVGFAAHQVAGQTASFNSILNGVLSTLGPWGIAIGVGAGALLHFADSASEAHKELLKLNDEKRKQAGLDREKAQDFETDALLQRRRLNADKASASEEKARRQIDVNHQEERDALEELVVMNESRGKSAEGARRRQAELREETLREQAAISGFEKQQELYREADAVAREEKLRRLEAEGRHEKDITANKEKQLTLAQELEKMLRGSMARVPVGDDPSFGRTGQDTLADIESLSARKPAPMGNRLEDEFSEINRDGSTAAEAQAAAEKRLEESRQAWAKGQEERHAAEVKRLDEQLRKQEALGQSIGNTVGNVTATILSAQDMSAEGIRKALAAWGKAESIKLAAVAVSEGVQAVVSAAFFNFPQAALHGAAAGQAAAGAAIVAAMTGALGGFGGITKTVSGKGGVFGRGGDANGANFGPGGSDSGAANVPGYGNGQTDTMPTSPLESAQQSSSGKGGSNVVNIERIDVTGAVDDSTAIKIAQAIKRTQRKAGNF